MADRDPNARVNAEQVSDIISTTLTEAQTNAFINSAHRMVEQTLAEKNLSEELLTEIEMWLSAHLLSMRDQRKSQVRDGDLQVAYQGKTGMGLQSTLYGQQVLTLDPTGSLSSLGQKRASIRAE